MSRLKKYFLISVVCLMMAITTAYFVSPFIGQAIFSHSAAALSRFFVPERSASPLPSVVPTFTPSALSATEIVQSVQPSIAAIQSFVGGRLAAQGSGIVLTRDGLIATTLSVVPVGGVTQANIAGQIFNSAVVSRDWNSGVALIQLEGKNFPVARLKNELPAIGDSLITVLKKTEFGKDSVATGQAVVSQVDGKGGQFTISSVFEDGFNGSSLVDGDANILGLVDFRSKNPIVITAKIVEKAVAGYLTKPGNI